jgi:excisionase family DNA binding protein
MTENEKKKEKPPTLDELPDLMNAEEIAALFRVDRKTIYEANRNGVLIGKRFGKRLIRFPRASVLKWAEG